MRHAPFQIDQTARDRWVELITAALDEAEFAPEVAAVMRDYFENGASFLINAQ
jgi:hemoglobin